MSNHSWLLVDALLLILSLLCFLVEAHGGTTRVKANLLALGLAFWVTVSLISTLRALN